MMNINKAAYYFSSFRKLERAYINFQVNALADYDLSPNEIVVISSIDGGVSASDIAKDGDVSKALVSRSIKFLKSKDYIKVGVSPNDHREQSLALTAEGFKIAELIDEANRRFFATAFANLDDSERATMKQLLLVMMRNLSINP